MLMLGTAAAFISASKKDFNQYYENCCLIANLTQAAVARDMQNVQIFGSHVFAKDQIPLNRNTEKVTCGSEGANSAVYTWILQKDISLVANLC